MDIQRHFDISDGRLNHPPIVDVYMKRRAELQRAGATRGGWTVRISSTDAVKMRTWADAMDRSAADIGMIVHTLPVRYGATWVEDVSIPEGEVRIDIPDAV